MTRETNWVVSLVEMADTLVDDFDVIDLLTGLADRCVSLLGISAAGVMLASPGGTLTLVASSSDAMRVVELFELQAEEGPCLDAFRTGEAVEPESLQLERGRWPQFSAVAIEAGFRSVLALPLRLRDRTIGALNLFNVADEPLAAEDITIARAFTDLATISVLQHGAATQFQRVNEQLSDALTKRVLIEQAKGVIFERAGIDMDEAFTLLRNYARNHNLHLSDVAQAAIDGSLPEEAWQVPPRS